MEGYVKIIGSAAVAFKKYTYSQAMAMGSLGGLTYEFITERGGDLAFVFFAGALGALAGGVVKWTLERVLPKKKKNESSD